MSATTILSALKTVIEAGTYADLSPRTVVTTFKKLDTNTKLPMVILHPLRAVEDRKAGGGSVAGLKYRRHTIEAYVVHRATTPATVGPKVLVMLQEIEETLRTTSASPFPLSAADVADNSAVLSFMDHEEFEFEPPWEMPTFFQYEALLRFDVLESWRR